MAATGFEMMDFFPPALAETFADFLEDFFLRSALILSTIETGASDVSSASSSSSSSSSRSMSPI
jgi:hypothetical protein